MIFQRTFPVSVSSGNLRCLSNLLHYDRELLLFAQVRHCQEIGISNKRSSYLYVGLGLGSFVFRVAAGKLCEFVNPVYVYQVGCFCSGIVTLVLSMTSSYSVLVVITLIYGMADGVFFTTFNVIVLSVVEHEQRPYAYACANTAASVAFTLGPMITGMT